MSDIHLANYNLDSNPTPGMGRLISIDPEDKNFPMAAAGPSEFEVTRTSMFWETGDALNQGSTYECTAYSAEQLLMSGPVKNSMYLTPHELYKLNQLNDEWPGENYNGSSVRASMKVLQAAGFIENYVWAQDADTVRRWVLMKGPVLLGTNWYNEMMKPNKQTEFIRPKGKPMGGHAYLIRGCDDKLLCPDKSRGAFRIINSWGSQWGSQGKAWLSYKDADGLIKNHGEAVTPVEMFCTVPKVVTGVIS